MRQFLAVVLPLLVSFSTAMFQTADAEEVDPQFLGFIIDVSRAVPISGKKIQTFANEEVEIVQYGSTSVTKRKADNEIDIRFADEKSLLASKDTVWPTLPADTKKLCIERIIEGLRKIETLDGEFTSVDFTTTVDRRVVISLRADTNGNERIQQMLDRLAVAPRKLSISISVTIHTIETIGADKSGN